MAATLLLDTLDLSSYLDLAPGDGADPAAPDYSQRIIGHSILREGGTFAREDRGVKTLNFPLYLKAASKDALHALVQQVNRAADLANQTVTWTDEGASQPTTFDLVTGQLDIGYDFRRAQHFYAHATLRLYVQPFGRSTAPRIVATLAGTGPVITLSTPSPILGDVAALAIATTTSAVMNGNSLGVVRNVALSVLPVTTYQPQFLATAVPNWFGASSYGGTANQNIATIMGASGAVASMFKRIPVASQASQVATWLILTGVELSSPVYAGNQRVLMIARPMGPTQWIATSSNMPTIPVWISDGNGNSNAPVGVFGFAQFQPTAWQLYDMGVVKVDPNLHQGNTDVRFWTTRHSAPSCSLDITAVIVLPEDSTVWIADQAQNVDANPDYGMPDPAPSDFYFISGVSAFMGRMSSRSFGFDRADVTRYSRGMVPAVPAGPSGAQFAVLMFANAGNDFTNAAIAVTERVRFAF